MADSQQISVSTLLNSIFAVAKTSYYDRYVAWTNFSAVLAGRFSLPIAMISLQRQGDLDLLLHCIEDEYQANMSAQGGINFIFHYQIMLSESWVVACYEILRAFRQRDIERGIDDNAVSVLPSFKALLSELELLRMPIAKYEIAKDRGIKQPLHFVTDPPNGDATDGRTYRKDDPARSHLMPTKFSNRGSVTWLALDHSAPREYWIERRGLSDRLLALSDEITPAGILEAQRATAGP